jgi:hypothetical protein
MIQCLNRVSGQDSNRSLFGSLARQPDEWALFVDVDAWLVERPHAACTSISIRTLALLGALYEHLHGAVALISARPIQELDELLFPFRAPCAGLQGLERRDALGGEHRLRTDSRLAHARSLDRAREIVSEMTLAAFLEEEPFAHRHPLWLAADARSAALGDCLTRHGGAALLSRRRREHSPTEAPLADVARVLLGGVGAAELHGVLPRYDAPVRRSGAAWTSPSTAQ